MSEEGKTQVSGGKEDLMEGGFAVVDRERIIEEETKEVSPWYKNIIHLFTAPVKAMENTILADPPKGLAPGFIVAALLGVILIFITYKNPLQKIALMDTLRASGIAEDQIADKYELTLITSYIGIVAGIAIGALMVAVIFQIMRAICKDKGSFKKLFTIAIFSQVVVNTIGIVDGILQLIIGTKVSVLGIGAFISAEVVGTNPVLQTLVSMVSIGNIWGLIILAVGYKVMTQKSMKKAIIITLIYELVTIGYTYGTLALSQMATQMVH